MAPLSAACGPVDDMPASVTTTARTHLASRLAWIRSCAALWAAAMALVAACGPARPTGTPLPPGVLFQDDFSNPNSGWDKYAGADVTTDYDNGKYLIAVTDPGLDVWGQPGLDLADVAFSADTQYVAGPANNEFGLMCRYERGGDGKNSFYFFLVSSDGYFALGKVIKDVRTILSPSEGSFQPTSTLLPAQDATNQIQAVCQGDHLSMSVNGTPVGEFTDGDLDRGGIGLVAGTFDEGGVRIQFDNVLVKKP
jgi:hypothetical protein